MPRKKQETTHKPTPDRVEGLRAEVLEQNITDTLELNYMPYAKIGRAHV